MWQQERALACPGCGQPKDEVWVFSPDEQHAKEAKWQSKMRKCVVCAARDWRSHQHHSQDHPDRFGVWPTVERTGDG